MELHLALWLAASLGAFGVESTLSIRVVDPYRLPVPGAAVSVIEVADCEGTRTEPVRSGSRATNVEGLVDVSVTAARSFVVKAALAGFEARQECVRSPEAGRAYVQIALRPDLANQITWMLPAVPENGPARLVRGDFAGVYRDADGAFYEVRLRAHGLELNTPDGMDLRFPNRRGSTFSGKHGQLVFHVTAGHVAGFSLERISIHAKRR